MSNFKEIVEEFKASAKLVLAVNGDDKETVQIKRTVIIYEVMLTEMVEQDEEVGQLLTDFNNIMEIFLLNRDAL